MLTFPYLLIKNVLLATLATVLLCMFKSVIMAGKVMDQVQRYMLLNKFHIYEIFILIYS